jgi:hypothetical protein
VTEPRARFREPKPLEAGSFQPEISSFRLHLAAEGKAVKTVRTYTEAVRWFAAAHLNDRSQPGAEPGQLLAVLWPIIIIESSKLGSIGRAADDVPDYMRSSGQRDGHPARPSRVSVGTCAPA